jgi:tetratricopeptide (TPR) repeat protein
MMRSCRTSGDEHPKSLLYRSNLGYLLCSLGRLDEAEALTQEVLDTRRRLFGDAHTDTIQSVHNLATLLAAKGDVAGAELEFRRALEGRVGSKDRILWGITLTRDALAKLLVSQQRFAEAEAILLEAERDTAAFDGATANQRRTRARELAAFYETWERAEPGLGHADRAAAWKKTLRSNTD